MDVMKFQGRIRMKHYDSLTVLDNPSLEVWYQESPSDELLLYDPNRMRAIMYDDLWKAYQPFPIDPVLEATLEACGWVKIGEL